MYSSVSYTHLLPRHPAGRDHGVQHLVVARHHVVRAEQAVAALLVQGTDDACLLQLGEGVAYGRRRLPAEADGVRAVDHRIRQQVVQQQVAEVAVANRPDLAAPFLLYGGQPPVDVAHERCGDLQGLRPMQHPERQRLLGRRAVVHLVGIHGRIDARDGRERNGDDGGAAEATAGVDQIRHVPAERLPVRLERLDVLYLEMRQAGLHLGRIVLLVAEAAQAVSYTHLRATRIRLTTTAHCACAA